MINSVFITHDIWHFACLPIFVSLDYNYALGSLLIWFSEDFAHLMATSSKIKLGVLLQKLIKIGDFS